MQAKSPWPIAPEHGTEGIDIVKSSLDDRRSLSGKPAHRNKSYLGGISRICILDDFVERKLRTALAQLLSRPIWSHGWKSNSAKDRFSYWHTHFAGGGKDNRLSCEKELNRNASLEPVNRLWLALKSGPLKGHEPVRVYANAHTYGTEGYIHTDNSDQENYFTTVYFAHSKWIANWAGETIFYNLGQTDIVAAVFPKPGRIVSFHGALPHCARAPSRDCPDLRLSLVVKTQRVDLRS